MRLTKRIPRLEKNEVGNYNLQHHTHTHIFSLRMQKEDDDYVIVTKTTKEESLSTGYCFLNKSCCKIVMPEEVKPQRMLGNNKKTKT